MASTLHAGANAIFAVVGVVATGASISDAMRGGSAVEPEATEPDLERVDCYVGGSIVEVTVDRVGDTGPEGMVAYCFGVEPTVADRQAAIECARSAAAAADAAAEARRSQESASADAPPTVIGPSGDARDACSIVEETDAIDPADADRQPSRARQFDSWDEAAGSAAWQVLRPGWLPDGYDLAALQGFSGENGREAVDWVSATYLRNGILLSLDQFEIVDPDDRNVEVNLPGYELGDVSAGQTTVGDHPAFWASALVGTLGGSEIEVLELVWNDGRVGYRITARNEDLEALKRIAESLTER
jgi:hypothetical protein